MNEQPLYLAFEAGALVIKGAVPERLAALPYCQQDPRIGDFRSKSSCPRRRQERYCQTREHYQHRRNDGLPE